MTLTRRATGADPGPLAFDEQDCRRALAVLPEPSGYFQLFALPPQVAFTAPSGDVDALVAAAADFSGSGYNVYFGINPVLPSFAGTKKRASASGVVKRRWLFLDVDPVKPAAHKGDPATDKESLNASLVAGQIVAKLYEFGFHVPVELNSGNGTQLYYRVDLPNDTPSSGLLHAFLEAVEAKFAGGDGRIDMVNDAPRLGRMPGFLCKKGTATEDRPYRVCKVVQLPGHLPVITAEQIAEATRRLRPPSNGTTPHPPAPPKAPRCGLKLRVPESDRVTAYGKKAFENEIEALSTAPEGERNKRLNKAAFSLYQLVAGGALDGRDVALFLVEAAKACGLYDEDPKGSERTIRSGREAGLANPRSVPEKMPETTDGGPAPAEGQPDDAAACRVTVDGEIVVEAPEGDLADFDAEQVRRRGGGNRIDMWTMAALAALDLPEPRWVVPGILSEGLNILAGKPKQGKSMMALNLGLTIAAGGLALGDVRTLPGDVLYLSLEDNVRRVQQRARRMVKGLGVEVTRRLTVATTWLNQGRGGLDLIGRWAGRCEQPSLVIIDVWGRFKPPHKIQGSAYEQDYVQLVTLKTFVEARGFHALILLHCRKMASEDVLEEISGTMGLSGAADGIAVLNRSRSSNEAKIYVTGRDVPPQELALEFDPETFCWRSLGSSETVLTGKLQTAILGFMRSQPSVLLHAKTIADAIQNTPDGIRPVLHRLRDKGVIRQQNNAWVYPGPEEGGEVVNVPF